MIILIFVVMQILPKLLINSQYAINIMNFKQILNSGKEMFLYSITWPHSLHNTCIPNWNQNLTEWSPVLFFFMYCMELKSTQLKLLNFCRRESEIFKFQNIIPVYLRGKRSWQSLCFTYLSNYFHPFICFEQNKKTL